MLLTAVVSLAVLLETGGPSPERLLLLFLAIAGASVSQRSYVYNSRELDDRIRKWERSFLCSRCGNVFDSATDESAQPPKSILSPIPDSIARS